MKRALYSLMLFLLALVQVSVLAQVAPVPSLMNFQGRLTKPDGTPVSDGIYSLRFSLHDAHTGGTEKWNQTRRVEVRNGTFAVLLVAFPDDTFAGNLFLEIQVGTDAPLTPRQPLASVAYAMKANSVSDGSITGASIANGSITGDKLASGALNNLSWLLGGNSITDPATQFMGTTNNQPLVFKTNDTEWMHLTTAGRLGLGTSYPKQQLHNTGDYYGKGHVWLHAFEGDGQSGTAYLQARDTSGSSSIGMQFRIQNGGAITDVLRLTPIGDVGIGTTTPGAKLDVNGTAKMTGFRLPTGAGANKVLTSDASGMGTWQSLPDILLNGATAGGDLTGTYPNPLIANNTVTTAKLRDDAVTSGKISPDAASLSKVSGGLLSSVVGIGIGINTATPNALLEVVGLLPTGSEILDQQQPISEGVLGALSQWQSFTAGAAGLLTRVDLKVSSPLGSQLSSPGTLSIYAGEGTGGTLLTTQSVTFQPVNNQFQSFAFTNPPLVTVGQKYTIRFSVPNITWSWVSTCGNNPYSGGRSDKELWTDYVFKTYVTPAENGIHFTIANGRGVGIGRSLPTATLDVNGNVAMTGFLLPTGASANRVLTSDANGVGTWQTVSTLIGATGGDLAGTYPNPLIANHAVTTAKINDNAVTTGKIADNAVTSGKLASDAASLSQVSGGIMSSIPSIGIGINTTAPDALLEVAGQISASSETLDQQQAVSNAGTQGTNHWQSLTAGATGLLTRVDLKVASPLGSQSSPGTLSIYAGEGTGGALLATQSVTLQPITNQFQSFAIANAVPVTAGSRYTILISVPQVTSNWVSVNVDTGGEFKTSSPSALSQWRGPGYACRGQSRKARCTRLRLWQIQQPRPHTKQV